MSGTRPPARKPRFGEDFTVKLRYCKGCHNEVKADMAVCPVCGTPIAVGPNAAPKEPSSPGTETPAGPTVERDPEDESE